MARSRSIIISSLLLVAVAVAAVVPAGHRQANGVHWSSAITPEGAAAWFCGSDAQCSDAVHHFDIPALRAIAPARIISKLAELVRLPRRAGLPSSVASVFRMARAAAGSKTDDVSLVTALRDVSRRVAGASNKASAAADQYPFFAFLPESAGDILPTAPVTLSTSCFGSITFSTTVHADRVDITVNAQNQLQWLCSDTFLFWGGGSGAFLLADAVKTYTKSIDIKDYSAAEKWILSTKGVTIFKFARPVIELVGDLIDTVTLMAGFVENPISATTMADNAAFLRDYVQNSTRMQPLSVPRPNNTWIIDNIDTSVIQSGDLLAVVRYDGLDPMIGWGEGATAGHTTVAMRDTTGALHVCESTVNGSYWPVNGVQCTPWAEWRGRVKRAQFNLVLAPLSPKYRSLFNVTKAWEFFYQHEGFNYGYLNFLFGWIDTPTDDFPCLPPDFKICLTKEFVRVIATFIDRLAGDSGSNIFRQALNHRAGTVGLPVPDIIQHAATKMNISFSQLYSIPEMDHWQYNTSRYFKPAVGPSMVCCVFVCAMWKAAGIFSEIDNQIQCTEQTIWDIASMNIFDRASMGSGRPAMCVAADPTNALCQLTGEYTFHLKPDLNTRRLYKNMGEKCSSIAPDYIRRPGC